MKHNRFIYPPCGESVAVATKEGQNRKDFLVPRLTAVLPPQGRDMSAGFTLVELLIVIIIIAVLAIVAWPQYKHAVLKSRFSTVMPVAKAVADAQEVYYLGKNMYAMDVDELDVTPAHMEKASVALSTEAEENKYIYVAANRSDVPGARYIMYQQHSPQFADNIHCEAAENNDDALWLCEKGLQGTEIPGSVNTSAGEYKTFLLAGTVDAADKLPTSFAKLVTNICAGLDEAHCIVDEQNQTVTTRECGAAISYYSSYTSSQQAATGCMNTTYDNEGNQTAKTTVVCNTRRATWQNDTCIPNQTGSGLPYEEIFDENGVEISVKGCSRTSNGVCVSFGEISCSSGFTRAGTSSPSSYCTGTLIGKERQCRSIDDSFNYQTLGGCVLTGAWLSVDTIREQVGDTTISTQLNCQVALTADDGSCQYQATNNTRRTIATARNADGESTSLYQLCPSGFTGQTCNDGWINERKYLMQYDENNNLVGFRNTSCRGALTNDGDCINGYWELSVKEPGQSNPTNYACYYGIDWDSMTCLPNPNAGG